MQSSGVKVGKVLPGINNDKAKQNGFYDFKNKWGERPLEDNWRRSNKTTLEQQVEDIAKAVDTLSQEQKDSIRFEELFAALPLDDESLKESKRKLVEANYNLGIIYKEQLNEPKKSVPTFKSSRFRSY